MKIFSTLIAALYLTACADQQAIVDHLDNTPLPSAKDSVPLALPDLAPLDLTAYKNIHYYVVTTQAKTYSCTTLDDVQNLDSLFFVLQDRIQQEQFIVVKYKNYYESDVNSSPKASSETPAAK